MLCASSSLGGDGVAAAAVYHSTRCHASTIQPISARYNIHNIIAVFCEQKRGLIPSYTYTHMLHVYICGAHLIDIDFFLLTTCTHAIFTNYIGIDIAYMLIFIIVNSFVEIGYTLCVCVCVYAWINIMGQYKYILVYKM